ncbi:hypothetical protein IJ425_03550 [bacterium]|nr:hypothetical protein [bacterium]
MKITRINRNKQPSFKQISVVQISKKAFANPEKLSECHELFSDKLAKIAIKEPTKTDLLTKLGLKRPPLKFLSTVEFPSFTMGKSLTEQYHYSLDWFRQNSGYNFKNAINPDAHTFIIFTKEDQPEMLNFTSPRTSRKLMNEARIEIQQREEKGEQICEFTLAGLFAKKLDELMSNILNKRKIESFKLENLDELEGIADKLDI